MDTTRSGSRFGAGGLIVGLPALALAGTAISAAVGDDDATAMNTTLDPLDFACNAGNAGNAGLIRRLAAGPVSVGAVLEGIVTKYGGSTPQSLKLLVVRIRDGREIVATGMSGPRTFMPGQIVPASHLGYPTTRGLMPDVENQMAQRQLHFVEAHVDSKALVDAVAAGRGDMALKAPGIRGNDVVVFATIPADLAAGRRDSPCTRRRCSCNDRSRPPDGSTRTDARFAVGPSPARSGEPLPVATPPPGPPSGSPGRRARPAPMPRPRRRRPAGRPRRRM